MANTQSSVRTLADIAADLDSLASSLSSDGSTDESESCARELAGIAMELRERDIQAK